MPSLNVGPFIAALDVRSLQALIDQAPADALITRAMLDELLDATTGRATIDAAAVLGALVNAVIRLDSALLLTATMRGEAAKVTG